MTCMLVDYSDRTFRPIELFKYDAVRPEERSALMEVLPPDQQAKIEDGEALGVYIIDNRIEKFTALLTIWYSKGIACIDTGTGSIWGEWRQESELLLTFELEEGKDDHGNIIMGRAGYNIHGIRGIYAEGKWYTLFEEEHAHDSWSKVLLSL